MKRNIQRIINELQNDSKIRAMHRDNIAKRQALRERRRALMLARMNKNPVAVYDDRNAKIEMMKMAFDTLGDAEALNRCIERGNNEVFAVALEVYEKRCDEKIARFRAKLNLPPVGNKVYQAA